MWFKKLLLVPKLVSKQKCLSLNNDLMKQRSKKTNREKTQFKFLI